MTQVPDRSIPLLANPPIVQTPENRVLAALYLWASQLYDWYDVRLPGWLAFTLPLVLLPVPAALLAFTHPGSVGALWAVELVLIWPGMDAGAVAGLMYPHQFTWWVVLLSAWWVQGLCIAWLVRNLHIMYKWAPAARFLTRQQVKAKAAYNRRPWLARFHAWGLAFFVFLPLSSGTFVGVFVGKLTGLSDRKVVAAVYAGSVVWAAVIVLGLSLLDKWIGTYVRDFLPGA